jgi:hypothetical protein
VSSVFFMCLPDKARVPPLLPLPGLPEGGMPPSTLPRCCLCGAADGVCHPRHSRHSQPTARRSILGETQCQPRIS